MNISQRLRTCARHTGLDAVIELLQEAADEIDALQARAILSLRPEKVPMTNEELKAARLRVCDDPNELPEPWAFRMGVYAAEAHHGITAQAKKETP